MKFTKEQVLEHIKASFIGATGNTALKLSDRTLAETIDTLLPFAGEEVTLEDFSAKIRPIVDSANRNLIKEQSDFIKDYKPTPPAPPTPPIPPVPPTPPIPPIPPVPPQGFDLKELAKIVTEAVKPLQDRISQIDQKEKREKLFSDAKAKFEGKHPDPKRQSFAEKAWKTVTNGVADDITVDALATAYEAEYNDLCKLSGINGFVPLNSDGTPKVDTGFKAVAEKVIKSQTNTGNSDAVKKRLGLVEQK